jgi:hypothetical protein
VCCEQGGDEILGSVSRTALTAEDVKKEPNIAAVDWGEKGKLGEDDGV